MKMGGQFLDTANAYREEESEIWIGEWMKARGNRDELVLATKYSAQYQSHTNKKQISNFMGNNVKSMKLSLEASLKKLQTDYIDIFYLHWWDYATGVEEVMQGLNDLVRSGKVLYLGISDTPAWVVSKANQYARDYGLRPFVIYQGEYNASKRDFERDIIPMAHDEGMALAIYGSLNQGRFQTEAEFKKRESGDHDGRNFIPTSDHDKKVSKVLEDIATRKRVPLLSIALSYVINKAPYIFPIVGGRKVEHLQGNIDALAVSLTPEEIDEIEASHEFDPGFPHTFLSGTMFFGGRPKAASKPDDVWLTNMASTIDWVQPPSPIKPHQGK